MLAHKQQSAIVKYIRFRLYLKIYNNFINSNLLENVWRMMAVENNTASCLQKIRIRRSQTQMTVRTMEILSPIEEKKIGTRKTTTMKPNKKYITINSILHTSI